MTHSIRRAAGALVLAGCALAVPSGEAAAQELLRLDAALAPAGPEQRWAPSRATLRTLHGQDAVRLGDIDLPGEPGLEIELERVDVVGDGVLKVNGVEVAPLAAIGGDTRSSWSGRVVGREGSRVFLTFSDQGVRGWVHLDGRLIHALPQAGDAPQAQVAGSEPAVRPSRFLDDASIAHLAPARDFGCGASCAPAAAPSALVSPFSTAANGSAAPGVSAPIYRIELVLQTDYRYFLNFANATEAAQYALDLVAAASATYTADAGIALEVSDLELHTSYNDPWSGTTPEALLPEMRSAWLGGLRHLGDAGILLSGHSGGGLAYVDALCGSYSVGVCNGIRGNTPFPISQSPLNWDFVVFSHELGHIVASPHTHDYCPPLDTCAPSGYQGACQSSQTCGQGTLMSYCHLCAGGVSNIVPSFHPSVAAVLRAGAAAAGCVDTVSPPPSAPPSIAQVAPSFVPVVVEDLATLTLTGSGFSGTTAVRLDGVELSQLPPQFHVVDDGTLEVALPHTGGIGQHILEVVTPHGTDQATFTRVANYLPVLDLAQSNPGHLVSSEGADFHVGAWPGDTVYLFVSAVRAPSVLPGLVSFEIGAGFTSWLALGAHVVPWSTGQVHVHLNLPPSLPAGFELHAQAASLSGYLVQFPVPVSNAQSGTVLF
jgi:hypothetical protein